MVTRPSRCFVGPRGLPAAFALVAALSAAPTAHAQGAREPAPAAAPPLPALPAAPAQAEAAPAAATAPTPAPAATAATPAATATAPGAAAATTAAPLAPRSDPASALPSPRVHHAPILAAKQREPMSVSATFEHPEVIRRAVVVYRTANGVFATADLQRSASASYVASIPPEAVLSPWIGYAIEIERIDGTTEPAFASREALHVVQVLEDASDARERAAFTRLSGRRSVVTVSAEYVRFGQTEPGGALPCGKNQDSCTEGQLLQPSEAAVDDQYYRVEAGYTYRPLTTVAEFSLRGGIIRGTSLVPSDTYDESKYKVGANYGAPTVRFRLADAWHLETEFLTSITEIGFSVGFGSALLIGDPYGTKLTLGFETIGPGSDTAYFGSRFYSRVDIAATSGITVAPLIEVTDMPHADDYGVRLLGEAGFALGGGFGASVRAGYQARKSTSGGPSAGGSLSLAF